MLPNADPGELNPKDVWPNDDGWLAAAATDPNNPLDAAVVEGVPKIDDVLVVAGVPKMDDVVDTEPNIELDDAGLVGFPNIDELVVIGEPKTVVVCVGDPKPLVVLVVVADPNIEDTVVIEDVPNIDVLVFIGFPKIEEVVTEEPKIVEDVVGFVGVPNIDDEVVAFVDVPKTEGALVVFVLVPKTKGVLVEVLKIEEVSVVFIGELKIVEALFIFVEVLKIEVLVVFIGVLNIELWLVVLMEFPKILVVLVELIGVLKIEELVNGISKIGVLIVVTGVVGIISLSGVTGSDIIGVGLSEILEVVSVTVLLVIAEGTVTGIVLTDPKAEGTVEHIGSLTTGGSEKLNEDAIAVDVEVKFELVSDAVVFKVSLDTAKLKVENDVSGFELKLKVVSNEFFDLSSALNPENILEDSKGLVKDFVVSKLKVVNGISFGLSILFLIESVKLNVAVMLVFDLGVSGFTIDTLEKLKGIFSFNSVVPEISFKVAFVVTLFRASPKFKGFAIEDLKLKSTGSILDVTVEIILEPNIDVILVQLEMTVSFLTGSLIKTL